jgi:hypothetical protein
MKVACSSPMRAFTLDRKGIAELAEYVLTLPGKLHVTSDRWDNGDKGNSCVWKVWSQWDEERP